MLAKLQACKERCLIYFQWLGKPGLSSAWKTSPPPPCASLSSPARDLVTLCTKLWYIQIQSTGVSELLQPPFYGHLVLFLFMPFRDQISLFTVCSKQELEFLKSSKTRSCDLGLISRKKGRGSRKRRHLFRFGVEVGRRLPQTTKHSLQKQSPADSEHLVAETMWLQWPCLSFTKKGAGFVTDSKSVTSPGTCMIPCQNGPMKQPELLKLQPQNATDEKGNRQPEPNICKTEIQDPVQIAFCDGLSLRKG